jgi:hypothetical protein
MKEKFTCDCHESAFETYPPLKLSDICRNFYYQERKEIYREGYNDGIMYSESIKGCQ